MKKMKKTKKMKKKENLPSNNICENTHFYDDNYSRNNSLLVNGIFGSGKSTLICNIILYLDKILTHEEEEEKKKTKKSNIITKKKNDFKKD